MPTQRDRVLAQLLLEAGILSPRQTDECTRMVEESETAGRPRTFGEVALAHGLIQEKPLRDVLHRMDGFPVHSFPKGMVVGSYVILQELGHGGTGPAYMAAHRWRPGEAVVLKTLPAPIGKDPEFRERLFRQTIQAMQLQHMHVARTIEADVAGDVLYVVQEHVPGHSVAAILRQAVLIGEIEARAILIQAALALRHAADRGIVHGNVKPSNLILTPAGTLKVTDFAFGGFCGWNRSIYSASDYLGSPYYGAPEQGRPGTILDARTDMYSLGVVFYEMVTGVLPFAGDVPILDLHRRLTREWPDPRSRNPDLGSPALGILRRMTELNRDGRYRTFDELLKALGHVDRLDAAGGHAARGPSPGRIPPVDVHAETRAVPPVTSCPADPAGEERNPLADLFLSVDERMDGTGVRDGAARGGEGIPPDRTTGQAAPCSTETEKEPTRIVVPSFARRETTNRTLPKKRRAMPFWAIGVILFVLAAAAAYGLARFLTAP